MLKALVVLVALWALVSLSQARTLMFFADQTGTALGLNNAWSGIAYAWATRQKGAENHRLRIFGGNHINESLTGAWIQYANGTIIEQLAVSTRATQHYFLGDIRITKAVWQAMLLEEVYATVASTSNPRGSISGFFRCRPFQGFAILSGSQVVGGSTSSSAFGIAWMELSVGDIYNQPQDIIQQNIDIANSLAINGRVLHDLTGVTSITYNGICNTTNTCPILNNATLVGTTQDGLFINGTANDNSVAISYGLTYVEVISTSGTIRGQVYPLLKRTLKRIPYRADTVNGNTILPRTGFTTLRRNNQESNENNKNSYISLQATLSSTNYTYLGVFYFNGAVIRRNDDLVRGYTIELNLRISGSGTWLFEFFDAGAQTFIPVGTISTAAAWTRVDVEHWNLDVNNYLNKRSQLAIRVSVNSLSATTLDLDDFDVETYIPGSIAGYEPGANQAFKDTIKIFNSYPGKFQNGTLYNP
jgi:hypothetical protein